MLVTESLRKLINKKKRSYYDKNNLVEGIRHKLKKRSLLNRDPDSIHDPFENPEGLQKLGISGQKLDAKTWNRKLFVLIYTLTALDRFTIGALDTHGIPVWSDLKKGVTNDIVKQARGLVNRLEEGREIKLKNNEFIIRLAHKKLEEAAFVKTALRVIGPMVLKKLVRWAHNNLEGEVRVGDYIIRKNKKSKLDRNRVG